MASQTQYGRTLFIQQFKGDAGVSLKRVHFSKTASEKASYDEAWLQSLIMDQPNLLPIDQIESIFTGLVPVCTELPLPSGYLDNLLVTPDGDLALIECKLWSNPEARREVVGQILDYAKDVSVMTYQRLQEAISRTKSLDGSGKQESQSLYEIASAGSEMDEASFVDAVSRNLRLGRFLLLIVGDGIREGVESMTEFLQQHAGLHFTLGIVEIALFEMPTGGYIVQPRVLARTININRGIVTLEEGRIAIKPSSGAVATSAMPVQQMTITKEHYLERLEQLSPGISQKVNAFIDKLAAYSVTVEFGTKSMILRWYPDDTKSWNLGTIPSSGDLWLDFLSRQASGLGLIELSRQYLRSLAALIPGALVKEFPNQKSWYIALGGKAIKLESLLENEARADGWLHAISEFQAAVTKALSRE